MSVEKPTWDAYRRKDDRESLERLKRWPSLIDRFPQVRIYSREHGAFWRNTGQGYTESPADSAVWDSREAFHRVKHCGPGKQIYLVAALQEKESEHGNQTG